MQILVMSFSAPQKRTFKFIHKRKGFNSFCLCLDCLNQLRLDLGDEESIWRARYGFNREKDKRQCNKCLSNNVKTVFELRGHPCPKCKEGTIEEIETGVQS